MTNILTEITQSVERINDTFILIEDWEISPIVAYKNFRYYQGIIDNALKLIENRTRDMVEENPLLHKDFRISTRKTYDFKSSDFYNQKLEEIWLEKAKEEIKEVEKLLITATDLGKVIYDDNWVAIEPVEVKYNQILSYTPKKK